MSSTNMWSDDDDGSSSSSLRGGVGEASSPGSEDRWPLPAVGEDTDVTDMDVDEDSVNDLQGLATPTQGYYAHNYMSDDDDDDMIGGGGAPVDILAATSVLSHGIDLEDFGPAVPIMPHQTQGSSQHTSPAVPGHNPVTFSSFNLGLQIEAAHQSIFQDQHPAAPTAAAVLLHGAQQGNHFTAIEGEQGAHPPNNQPLQVMHPQLIHPNAMSNPHAPALGPENYNLSDFVTVWAWQNAAYHGTARERGRYPWLNKISPHMARSISHVDYMDLEGDRHDVQGIDWEDLGVNRSEARERRLNTYKNYVNINASDRWEETQGLLPCSENYFRFRRLDIRKNIKLAHFQLRNILASTTRGQVFYPGQNAVHEFNPVTGKSKVGMRSKDTAQFQVSTMAAGHDTLVAGGFFGEYCFRRLSSEGSGDVHEGTITTDNSGITNHVQVHASRTSSSPRAAFASNDNGFRVLDLETEKFVSETIFPRPVNCSAISPDGRLRVMVGDQTQVLITKAEADGRPEILQMLDGHGDFGFACDWADDGWTIATGFQDKSVKIWDARRWTDSRGRAAPVCTLRSEIAGVRSLRFSPLGSGKRVLVAAEEADFVNIYDAQTFQSKQTFDFFGEIGGTSFVNEGQDLHILCCDRNRGGLFRLERCGTGAERHHDPQELGARQFGRRSKNGSYDWQEFKTTPRRIPRSSETRRRRALGSYSLSPF